MAASLKKKGHAELAEVLEKLTPEEIWKYAQGNNQLNALKDSHQYDDLLQKMIKKSHPNLAVSEINSNYNFFKNKLNDSFTFKPVDNLIPKAPLYQAPKPSSYTIPKVENSKLTLNAEHYISNRQTRGLIWDSIKNGREIEFYLEPLQEAMSTIEARGGKIVGEVRTLANNYNKNYLVHYPAENRYAHIITDISGTDRLYHLTKQLSIISWEGKTAASVASGKVNVFGPLDNIIEHESRKLKTLLNVLPQADNVIIGQKGAMERTVRTAMKVEKVLEFLEKSPSELAKLTTAQQKVIGDLKANGNLFSSFGSASVWDNIYAKLERDIGENIIDAIEYNLELNSHAIADVNIKVEGGKNKRFRLISNVWGNEATPIAEALAETNHKNITYIGTAGSLGDSYKVGDLVSPTQVQLANGEVYKLADPSFKPKGLIRAGKLTQVASLFDETEAWLAKQLSSGNDLVEMEVGYLAKSFSKKSDTKFNVFLLVSDVVGEEGETLDQASSSRRKKSQVAALESIFEQEKALSVIPASSLNQSTEISELDRLIREIESSRNPLASYQAKQVIKKEFGETLPSKNALEQILKNNKSFTPAALQKRLNTAQRLLKEINLGSVNKNFSFIIEESFFDGSYHPSQKLKITFDSDSSMSSSQINEIFNQNPEFTKAIEIDFRKIEANEIAIKKSELKHFNLVESYNNRALTEGGLLGKLSKQGNLSYSPIPSARTCPSLLGVMNGVLP
jgi:nucleoside phosphorylase